MSQHATIDLPDLDTPYTVTPEQQASYREKGHICLRNICKPDEVEAYRPALQEGVANFKKEQRPLAERGTYHKAFLQVGNLWRRDERIKRFVFAKRFAKIAADLMGVSGVRLWHDQALFKEIGGGFTPWHQDQFYWPLDTDNTITMWMPLTKAPVESGAMTFANASHREGSFGELAIGDESAQFFHNFCRQRGWTLETYDLDPGDATFHNGWTLHKAPGNSAGYVREVMTIIYYPDNTRVSDPVKPGQQADLDAWLAGCVPGGPAASDITPVLYSR